MLLELSQEPFFVRVLLAGLAVGILCGLISVSVVVRQLSFLGEGLGHSSLLGIAIAAIVGQSPWVGAIAGSVVISLLLSFFQRRRGYRSDTMLAILFSVCLALAVVLLQSFSVSSVQLTELLFGNLLLVSNSDVWILFTGVLFVVALLLLFYRPLLLFLVDEGLLARQGFSASLVHTSLYLVISLVVVCSIKICGVLLTTALLAIPGAISLRVAQSVPRAIAYSVVIGVTMVLMGILSSWHLDTPPGATIILVGGCMFFLSERLVRQ